jgi:serine O-acetyltransferase
MMKYNHFVAMMMDAYAIHPIRKDHCSCRLPNNTEIKKILFLTKEIIFPGYFTKKNVSEYGSKSAVRRQIRALHRLLRTQISLALLYLADERKNKGIHQKSCELCVRFLERIPEIRHVLHRDLEAHFIGDPAAFNRDQIIVSYPGFYAIVIYRIAHSLWELGVPIIPRMMSEFAHRETGIDINPGAKIGEAFFIDHGTGVVIGETAVIGDHVKIYQGVTLGALSTKGGQNLKGIKRHPTIEDHVTIYAGASILGGNTVIGSNATIGSNVFITESVPAHSKVSLKVPDIYIKPAKREEETHENL